MAVLPVSSSVFVQDQSELLVVLPIVAAASFGFAAGAAVMFATVVTVTRGDSPIIYGRENVKV